MHTPSTDAVKNFEFPILRVRGAPSANDFQVGGDHYKKDRTGLQHWDVVDLLGWDYFQGNITKYVDRHAKKKGFEDLQKAEHYLHKYMELKYPDEYAAREAAKLRPLDSYSAKELMDELRRRAYEEEVAAMNQHAENFDPCRECGHVGGHAFECSHINPPKGDV